METETPAKLPAPANRNKDKQGAKGPRRGGAGVIIVILVLIGIAAAAWWYFDQQMRERDSGRDDALAAQINDLTQANQQLRRDVDSLRSRYNDAESMNRGIREEVLSFGERSRALEDAVANLSEQRLNNRDAMALNEAEFILQLAGERLALFRDASGAMAAYRLADSALAAAEDPLFASVRQTISAEMQALAAARPMQTRATLNTLADLRAGLNGLPMKANPSSTAEQPNAQRSRLREILDQFVHISHDEAGSAFTLRNEELTRSLIALDLRAAEAALFARDQEGFDAALKRARQGVETAFDTKATEVRATLASLDKLQATPLAPALPELGTALSELRNLRTTRALSHPMKAPLKPESVPTGPLQAPANPDPATSEEPTS
ncbi:MAG TPA: uroporphyrinogen-III C-methyltransferase [Dokdonella sp.]|uniref:uroporphyrinogen-III C-methyltransferase n=1 Tax=Dokdonella sp. TaxID=2291710 RepID=UPI002D8030D5|nr:uroporphyrinogen-III C-methyltransferase [Dokdonella sp.]HET9034200.1 uroporphyrinogen-III C-methyltransferase [Dokdonella sp.]